MPGAPVALTPFEGRPASRGPAVATNLFLGPLYVPTCDGFLIAATVGLLARQRYCVPLCRPSTRHRFGTADAYEPEVSNGDGLASREELLALLWTAARRGSVNAMKTLLAEHKRGQDPPPPSAIDELSRRRGGEG